MKEVKVSIGTLKWWRLADLIVGTINICISGYLGDPVYFVVGLLCFIGAYMTGLYIPPKHKS